MRNIVLILLCLIGVGCGNKPPAAKDSLEVSANWDPSKAYMAQHIGKLHKVIIGEGFGAGVHITVNYEDEEVWVLLSDDIQARTENEIGQVLKFTGNEQYMSREDYLSFLNQLHAYLTVSPIESLKNPS